MGKSYWIIEYLKVGAAYGFTMYVWPSVVFREHLRSKGLRYRFIFCTLMMPTILTTVISLLGIFKVLWTPLLAAAFYGCFIVRLLQYHNPLPGIRHTLHLFQRKTLTSKRLLLNMLLKLRDGIKRLVLMLWDGSKGHRLEYGLLLIALIYGTLYFSYGPVTIHTFAASDQYVHNSWAYSLSKGKIYPRGIYPIGMHCMLYVFSSFFGIKLFNTNLFASAVHAHAVLLSAYLMLKEFYSFRYTAMFGLFIFLTVGIPTQTGAMAMSRLTMTLPQEYAFTAVFLSACALLRYMKRRAGAPDGAEGGIRAVDRVRTEATSDRADAGIQTVAASGLADAAIRTKARFFLRSVLADEDLRVFILAVSLTIMIHYYATIMAFFLCVAVFISYIPFNLRWEKLLKLSTAVLLALLLSTAPTGIALMKGYKFQGSIAWALSITKGGKNAADETDEAAAADGDATAAENGVTAGDGGITADGDATNNGGVTYDGSAAGDGFATATDNGAAAGDSDAAADVFATAAGNSANQGSLPSRKSLLTRTIDAAIEAPSRIKEAVKAFDQDTFQDQYRGSRGIWMRNICVAEIAVSLTLGLVLLIVRLLSGLLRPGTGSGGSQSGGPSHGDAFAIGSLRPDSFTAYFCAAAALLVFFAAYSPLTIGLPRLIAKDRLCALIELTAIMVYCCLPDIVFSAVAGNVPETLISITVPVMCFGIYAGMYFSGFFHGMPCNWLTRYPITAELTERVINNVPKNKFTIVSPTEELYQLINYGYHEELIDFVLNSSNKTYTIPTPYIFVFLEKKPLYYAQIHFPDAPGWLGGDYYPRLFGYSSGECSIQPGYRHGEASAAIAAKELPQVELRSDYTMLPQLREILESRALTWYEAFRNAYPYDGDVIYEDDYLICYCIKQNEFSLFTLGVLD